VQAILPLALQLAVLAQTVPPPTESSTAAVKADQAHGHRVAPEDDSDDPGRIALQSILFIPRALTFVIFAPVRGALWLLETYEIPELLIDVFYNDDRTFGVFPTLMVESGFGVGGGLRMVARDILAEGTRFKLSGAYGGRFKQTYKAELSTGTLIADWFVMGLEGRYEDRPKDHQFGIGADAPDEEHRVQRERAQGILYATFLPTHYLRFTLSGLYSHWNIGNSEEEPGVNVDRFRSPIDLAYQELFIEIDTRKPAHAMIFDSTPSHGFYLGGSVGATEILSDPSANYWCWSVEGEWLIDLMHGNRVLALGAYVESVAGTLSEVPLVELPKLGGPEILRGYDRDRFQDRALTLVTAEYRFPISGHALGYVFVDAGRVFRTLEDFSFDNWRLGFGGGFDLFTRSTELLRVQAAGSKDGDFHVNLVFGADFDHEPRSER
jgi:hypothetical protein